eukprot:scaffold33189_cov38-Attheya_sp.AAC.1
MQTMMNHDRSTMQRDGNGKRRSCLLALTRDKSMMDYMCRPVASLPRRTDHLCTQHIDEVGHAADDDKDQCWDVHCWDLGFG